MRKKNFLIITKIIKKNVFFTYDRNDILNCQKKNFQKNLFLNRQSVKIISISIFISKNSVTSKKMRIISSLINQQMLIQKIQKIF